jgi:hypothetical protein
MSEESKRVAHKIERKLFQQLVDLVFVHKWLADEDEALIELWNLCEFETEQNLMYSLVKRFNYLTSTELKRYGKEIAQHIVLEWQADKNTTFLVAISDKVKADGSQMMIQGIKDKFVEYDWSEERFINKIGDGLNSTKPGNTVILLDDFIGSGSTIERRVNWYRKKLKEKNINNVNLKVVALAGLEVSKNILNNLDLEYFLPVWINRGISDYFKNEELDLAIKDMLNLENKLAKEVGDEKLPSFGFLKSEALFAIESFNIPNNVFPIFWWPYLENYKRRKTLFHRI